MGFMRLIEMEVVETELSFRGSESNFKTKGNDLKGNIV